MHNIYNYGSFSLKKNAWNTNAIKLKMLWLPPISLLHVILKQNRQSYMSYLIWKAFTRGNIKHFQIR